MAATPAGYAYEQLFMETDMGQHFHKDYEELLDEIKMNAAVIEPPPRYRELVSNVVFAKLKEHFEELFAKGYDDNVLVTMGEIAACINETLAKLADCLAAGVDPEDPEQLY